VKLAIADPPYPPLRAAHARNDSSRARRWYGDGTYRASGDAERTADTHHDAGEWDDPARHRALMHQLETDYDGWAIATAHDGIPAYGVLPRGARIMVWHKTNAPGSASRIRNVWEPVIIRPPHSRISSVLIGGQLPDLLTAAAPRVGFAGAKPAAWTRWVLDALGYDQDTDTVTDVFPGSGSVAAEIAQGTLL
jgi:hypothetical protein